MNHSTPQGDRIWGIWDVIMILDNSVFYLLKGDYRCRRGAWKKNLKEDFNMADSTGPSFGNNISCQILCIAPCKHLKYLRSIPGCCLDILGPQQKTQDGQTLGSLGSRRLSTEVGLGGWLSAVGE